MSKKDENEESRQRRDDDNEGGSNLPKFNFTWIYILIALALLGVQFYSMQSAADTSITWEQFDQMARNGDVEKVEIVNNETAYIYIKKKKSPTKPIKNSNRKQQVANRRTMSML